MELDGKIVGRFGEAGKQMKQFGSIHEIDCRNENEILVGELTNWRVQKLLLKARPLGKHHNLQSQRRSRALRIFASWDIWELTFGDLLCWHSPSRQSARRPARLVRRAASTADAKAVSALLDQDYVDREADGTTLGAARVRQALPRPRLPTSPPHSRCSVRQCRCRGSQRRQAAHAARVG